MLGLVTEIQKHMKSATAGELAAKVHGPILRLTGKLKIHLVQEDKALYPRMINSGNADASARAVQFQSEMGDLSATYMAFSNRWRTLKQIAENEPGFKQEASGVFQALGDRITRENRDLYPLADNL